MLWPLRKKPSEDANFEAVLEELASSISTREGRLLELRATERTSKHSATLYGLTLWVAYLGVWWTGMLGQGFKTVLPALLLPVLLYSAHRGLSWWFRRLGAKEELALKDLRKKQREELDKLKKKTKYDETRTLLERYDEKAKERMPGGFGSPANSQAGSPVGRGRGMAPGAIGPNATPSKQGGSPNTSMMSPGSRGWADRFADALLGDNEPQSKYALICGKCHQHNGLVLREELAILQYMCPRCGHLNPPKTATLQPHDSPDALPPPGMRVRTRSAGPASAQRMRHSLTGAEAAQSLRPHSMIEPGSGGRLPSPLSNGVSAEDEAIQEQERSSSSRLSAHERMLRQAAQRATDESFEQEDDEEERMDVS